MEVLPTMRGGPAQPPIDDPGYRSFDGSSPAVKATSHVEIHCINIVTGELL
jgi:hypothetical protein